MTYTLENDLLKVTIASLGAEVQSVISKSDNKELWWCGDPAFWHGHSPILFPACGGLWDGKYRLNGKEYTLPKHGFAKKLEFTLLEPSGTLEPSETLKPSETLNPSETRLSFVLQDNEETLQSFPFHFRLVITYTLRETLLECEAEVTNLTDGATMHYQIGGHPALALPDYDKDKQVIGYLDPARLTTTNLSVVRAGEQGCWSPERFKVQTNDNGMIPISVETFHNEALIFDNSQFHSMQLYRADAETQIAEVFFDAPVCLVWQMQDLLCPYVCIEPWFGLCDRQGYTMDLDYRPYTQHCMAHDTMDHYLWGIMFHL